MNDDEGKKDPTKDGDHKDAGGGDAGGNNDKPGAPITFKVNGVVLESTHEKLVSLDILKMAAEKGAVAGKPEDYILQDMAGAHKYKPDDWVELKQDEEFLAVPQGPTPVAGKGQ